MKPKQEKITPKEGLKKTLKKTFFIISILAEVFVSGEAGAVNLKTNEAQHESENKQRVLEIEKWLEDFNVSKEFKVSVEVYQKKKVVPVSRTQEALLIGGSHESVFFVVNGFEIGSIWAPDDQGDSRFTKESFKRELQEFFREGFRGRRETETASGVKIYIDEEANKIIQEWGSDVQGETIYFHGEKNRNSGYIELDSNTREVQIKGGKNGVSVMIFDKDGTWWLVQMYDVDDSEKVSLQEGEISKVNPF